MNRSAGGFAFSKRAKAIAMRVERIGNWELQYDSGGRLLRAREI